MSHRRMAPPEGDQIGGTTVEDPTMASFLLEITRTEDLIGHLQDDAAGDLRKDLEQATEDARELAAEPEAHAVEKSDFRSWTEGLDARLNNVEKSSSNTSSVKDLYDYFSKEIQPKLAHDRA